MIKSGHVFRTVPLFVSREEHGLYLLQTDFFKRTFNQNSFLHKHSVRTFLFSILTTCCNLMMDFQASAAMPTRFAFFRDFTQRIILVPERCSGTAHRPQPQGSSSPRRTRAYAPPVFSLESLTPEGGNVTLIRNVGTLSKIPKESRPHVLCQFIFTAILRDMHKAHNSLSCVILNCHFLTSFKSRHFPDISLENRH